MCKVQDLMDGFYHENKWDGPDVSTVHGPYYDSKGEKFYVAELFWDHHDGPIYELAATGFSLEDALNNLRVEKEAKDNESTG